MYFLNSVQYGADSIALYLPSIKITIQCEGLLGGFYH